MLGGLPKAMVVAIACQVRVVYTPLERRQENKIRVCGLTRIHSPPPSSCTAYGALCKDLPKDRVIFISVDVVDSDMSK